jgi:hypothetical protein
MADGDYGTFQSRAFRNSLGDFSSKFNSYIKVNSKEVTQAKTFYETELAHLTGL